MAERAYVLKDVPTERTSAPALHLVKKEPSTFRPVQHQSSREIATLVVFSVLLHAGVALGFYNQEKTPPVRHVSKVDVEISRPPEPPKPKVAPPPPPPPPAAPVDKIAKPSDAPPPAPTPSEAAPTEAPPADSEPVDTGSSAEAADDGNLFAGKGGSGVAPPPPPAPPAPKEAPPAPVVAAHEGANYSKNPRPGYPARAVREGWQGEVLVSVQVLPTGRAGTLKIKRSSGFSLLDDAALAAVKGWSFVPARQGGQPVSGWVTVPIVFRLQ